jgi:hypothetical protein
MKTLMIALAVALMMPAAASARGPYGAGMEWMRDVDMLVYSLKQADDAGELTDWEKQMVERHIENARNIRWGKGTDPIQSARAELKQARKALSRLASNSYRPGGAHVAAVSAR